MKYILLCLTFFSCLYGDLRVEGLKTKVCRYLPELQGWCSQEKALAFIDLVLEVHPKICVEIGVFGGSSLYPVASSLKFLEEGVVIGIDPWDKFEAIKQFDPITDSANLAWWGNLNCDHIFISYLNMIKRFGLIDHCITLRTTSEKASFEIHEIDILHLDGNHSAYNFLQDVQLYLPKVVSGGYIWFNDAKWHGTEQALALLLEECAIVKTIDTGNCILFQKR